MQLYNTLSADERAELIEEAGEKRLTLSFYAYAKIEDPQQFRDDLFRAWNELGVLGRIYVAHEGINAQLSVPAQNFEEFKETLNQYDFLRDVLLNIAIEQDDYSFLKLTIKVRKKIVADGLNDDTFDVTDKGVHVTAKEFNELIDDPDTIVVDFRNHYESEVGHFKNAVTPDVDTFRESLPIIVEQLKEHKEDKNILMYCTGGIRCEKASAYLKHNGFKNVFQKKGGIIEYAREVKTEGLENKFIGKNFVFDHRLGERISNEIIANCHQCGKPCDTHVNCANEACHLLFIQCEECASKMHGCCSSDCVEIISLPIEEQKRLRRGIQKGNMVYKKGRSEALKFKTNPLQDEIIPVKVSSVTEIRKKRVHEHKELIGKIVHYYNKAGVGQFELDANLNEGDKISITGPKTGDIRPEVKDMMVAREKVDTSYKGDKMTMKLNSRVRKNDLVYRILD